MRLVFVFESALSRKFLMKSTRGRKIRAPFELKFLELEDFVSPVIKQLISIIGNPFFIDNK